MTGGGTIGSSSSMTGGTGGMVSGAVAGVFELLLVNNPIFNLISGKSRWISLSGGACRRGFSGQTVRQGAQALADLGFRRAKHDRFTEVDRPDGVLEVIGNHP